MAEINVIITTYNLEKLLPVCLEELLAQTFQDFDVLIVDDCSRDNTAQIIQDYVEKYPRKIRAICLSENSGNPSASRNHALNSGLLNGKYTILIDGDDQIENNYLERLYTTAEENGADITVCGYDRVEMKTGRVLCKEMQGFKKVLDFPPEDDTLAFVNGALWNKLIFTEILKEERFPDARVGGDTCFSWILYPKCKRMAFIDDVLIHYQVRGVSVISNAAESSMHYLAEYFEARLHDVKDSAFRDVLSLAAFIHIGISMAMRAKDNANIDLSKHLAWTRSFLQRNGLLRGRGYLRLSSLMRHGVKGLAIWICRMLYICHGMGAFLALYSMATRLLRRDIKF